jgi:hypothetical protein
MWRYVAAIAGLNNVGKRWNRHVSDLEALKLESLVVMLSSYTAL